MSRKPRMTEAEYNRLIQEPGLTSTQSLASKQRQLIRENGERWTELSELRVEHQQLMGVVKQIEEEIRKIQAALEALEKSA